MRKALCIAASVLLCLLLMGPDEAREETSPVQRAAYIEAAEVYERVLDKFGDYRMADQFAQARFEALGGEGDWSK